MLSSAVIICTEGTSECPQWRMNKWDWRSLTKVWRACKVCGRENWHARLECVCFKGTSTVTGKVKPEALGSVPSILLYDKSHRCQHHCYCILCAVAVWHPVTPDTVTHTGAVSAGCLLSEHLTPALSKIWLLSEKAFIMFKGQERWDFWPEVKKVLLGELVSCACGGTWTVMQNPTAA